MYKISNYFILIGLLVATILLPSTALAYLPKTGHKVLLNIALEVYSECKISSSFYIKKEMRDRIIEGDVAMDEGLSAYIEDRLRLKDEGVFSLLRRPFNFHFYNPNKVDHSKIGVIEQSYVNLWVKVKKGFYSNDDDYDKLLFLGGLIHFVEDVTVPAHVVPVYHGPTSANILGPVRLEPYITYMQEYSNENLHSITDKIDALKPDIDRLRNNLISNGNLTHTCSDIKQMNQSPDKIRDETVLETLAAIEEEIPSCPGVTWQSFWTKPSKDEYFGKYNIKSVHLFGENGVITSPTGSECTFSNNNKNKQLDKKYKDFVHSLHLRAIKADMKLLKWADTELLGH